MRLKPVFTIFLRLLLLIFQEEKEKRLKPEVITRVIKLSSSQLFPGTEKIILLQSLEVKCAK